MRKTKPGKKFDRKNSSGVANDKDVFEDTAFGRRRVSRLPKPLSAIAWIAKLPFNFLYARLNKKRSK